MTLIVTSVLPAKGLELPYVFADHMVFQRGRAIPVFGTSKPGQKVVVTINGQHKDAIAGKQGRWRVDLPSMSAGGPYTLVVKAEKTIRFADVLIGEVWLAAGQSNMRFQLQQCARAKTELPKANHPRLRLLNRVGNAHPGGRTWSKATLDRCSVAKYYTGTWAPCTPTSAKGFSAAAYFFARRIHKELGVPVGIISMPVGGTIVEAFISRQGLQANPLLRPLTDPARFWLDNETIPPWPRGRGRTNLKNWLAHPTEPRPRHPFEPSFLFEAGLQPIIPYAIRGAIWYQGESNASTCGRADKALPQDYCRAGIEALVADWRKHWGYEFPFYHVQLPNLNRPWMLFREAQLQTLKTIPNSGLAITIDIGNPKNVHPKRKYEVGERLARWALAKTYGKQIVYSGPIAKAMSINGNSVTVSFDHIGSGLTTTDGKKVAGFELADASGRFEAVDARIVGDAVVLTTTIATPVAARYAWAPNPTCNLCNREGLPASPFRLGKKNE